jgi:hypothetical protein
MHHSSLKLAVYVWESVCCTAIAAVNAMFGEDGLALDKVRTVDQEVTRSSVNKFENIELLH